MNSRTLIAGLADLLRDVAMGKRTRSEVSERLRKLADQLDAPEQLPIADERIAAREEKRAKVTTEAQRIKVVFDYWRQKTGHERARLLPERATRIRARLRQFSVEDLCLAVDGCLLSEFHTGDNTHGEQYDWIENIMRNGAAVEKHIERARRDSGREDDPEVAKLRAAIDAAIEAGDTERSNALNRRLGELLS